VASEIEQLRVILQGVEARALEREFLKQQYHGELDDSRLVDGAAGSCFGTHFTCFTSTKAQVLTQKSYVSKLAPCRWAAGILCVLAYYAHKYKY
jgi:hypothetical protein